MALKVTEKKGDVTFFEDEKGDLFYQIKDIDTSEKKVKDWKVTYRIIEDSINWYTIKYDTNGVCWFSIWKWKLNLEDRFWTLKDAIKTTKEMKDN